MCPTVSKASVNSHLSAFTFVAKSWQSEAVSSNGLPLTANSISAVGKFQALKAITHENLAQYLNIERGKHGKDNPVLLLALLLTHSTPQSERL
jgi:hypothetical protein